MDIMDPMPVTSDLRHGDCLVVEFDDIQCLGGPHRWVLKINGDDSESVLIRTVGHMVIPSQRTVRLSKEQQAYVDEVLRGLSSYKKMSATSYQSFRLALSRNGEIASTWEFSRVFPPNEHFKAHHKFLELCKLVPHEYRKAYFWENVGAALAAVALGSVFVVVMLLGALWYPFRRVYRLIMR